MSIFKKWFGGGQKKSAGPQLDLRDEEITEIRRLLVGDKWEEAAEKLAIKAKKEGTHEPNGKLHVTHAFQCMAFAYSEADEAQRTDINKKAAGLFPPEDGDAAKIKRTAYDDVKPRITDTSKGVDRQRLQEIFRTRSSMEKVLKHQYGIKTN